jgi:acetylornithine deacetylase/succinyl-diaminopimelate desuccinylase-like protein
MPIIAIEALVQTGEELPVNFKFCIEGDEERGSPHVVSTIEANKELFSCDYFIHSDGTHLTEDMPSIELGCRGIIYTQIRVSTGTKDLHSGEFGGYVKNANLELARIVSSLKDHEGRITIPNFYDDVLTPNQKELDSWNEIPLSEEERRNTASVYQLDSGEKGYSLIERNWSRPALDINGIWGGYISEGSKTIIPFESRAKISMRLVPNQNPQKILDSFKEYLKSFENEGLKVELEWSESARPFLIDAGDPAFNKLEEAYMETFGTKAYYVRTGGTIGLLTGVQEALKAPILSINGRTPDEDIHAPNEFLRLKNFWRGIEVSLRFFEKMKAETSEAGKLQI